jgi:hypothetical protein
MLIYSTTYKPTAYLHPDKPEQMTPQPSEQERYATQGLFKQAFARSSTVGSFEAWLGTTNPATILWCAKNDKGDTALHHALRHGNSTIAGLIFRCATQAGYRP